MKRWIIVLGGLALLGIVGTVAAVMTLRSIDWSEYEEDLVAVVRDVTGRELTFRDGFEVHLGLTLELTLGGLGFENADWSDRREMLTLEHLALRVRLWPLLFGRVEFGRIELRGLDALLETNADGRPNWSSGGDTGKPGASPPGDAASEALEDLADIEQSLDREAEDDGLPISTVIRRAVVEEATIAYRNGKTGETLELVVDRFEARERRPGAPLRLELTARYQGEPLEFEGTVEGVAEVLAGGPLGAELELKAGGATLALKGTIEEPLEPRGIDLAVRAEGESLATLSGLAGTALPELGPYAIETQLQGGGDEYRATGLSLALGSTAVAGDVAAILSGKRPRIEASLHAPRLDLADLQGAADSEPAAPPPPAQAGGAPNRPAGDGRVFPAAPLPLDGLSALDAAISLQVEELHADELTLRDLALVLDLQDGVAVLDSFGASWSGGRVEGAATIDASSARPALQATLRVRQIDMGELARSQGTRILSGGLLDIDASLRGQGDSVRAIMASLHGQLGFEIGRGTVRDEWATRVMADVRTIGQDVERSAELNCAIGDFQIRSGIARPQHFVIDSPSLALIGDGDVDLRREVLNLSFDRQASNLSASSALPPFKVGGTLAEPESGIDHRALGSKVVDLGSMALRGSVSAMEITAKSGVPRCRQVLARYEKTLEEREQTKKKAKAAARKAGEETKKTFGRLKGFFGRE